MIFFLAYALNPGETDQHVVTRQFYWDCKSRTLGVERTWSAVLETGRIFGGIFLPAGAKYEQDDFVIFRFDENYKLVYYREYFDNNQFVSTYVCNEPPNYELQSKQKIDDYNTTITQALYVFEKINFAINILPIDAELYVDLFVENFAKNGVYSTSINPTSYPYTHPIPKYFFRGKKEIRDHILSYALNPGETNQSLHTRQLNWDPTKKTLFVQSTWTATLTQDYTFYNAIPVTLHAGDTYQQDDFIAIKFDDDYKVLYYREYYDGTQYESTFTNLHDPVAISKINCL